MKMVGLLIVLSLLITPAFAVPAPGAPPATIEAAAPNFWTEFDITFWQTLPFAAFWGYAVGAQLFPEAAARNGILAFAAEASAANAFSHARRITAR
ncbi:hypothetical protein HZB08_00680 [Candidatus Saganbacteria bacterium]|uniref:Uncharacterized protein n=1 Tax=Candidatus Saganbacteria bacterium TaxID=2575572 RepID=A0A9D6UK12_UNCSA|nr:hypothetical protein [Candidatus Saganbacteria bacterium]